MFSIYDEHGDVRKIQFACARIKVSGELGRREAKRKVYMIARIAIHFIKKFFHFRTFADERGIVSHGRTSKAWEKHDTPREDSGERNYEIQNEIRFRCDSDTRHEE